MDKRSIERMEQLLHYVDYDLQNTMKTHGTDSSHLKNALEQFGVAWLALRKLRSEHEFLLEVS